MVDTFHSEISLIHVIPKIEKQVMEGAIAQYEHQIDVKKRPHIFANSSGKIRKKRMHKKRDEPDEWMQTRAPLKSKEKKTRLFANRVNPNIYKIGSETVGS